MKKNYLWSYSLVALFLLFTACNTSEDEVIPESNKVNLEPDFFEKDGSMEESDIEEEAPEGVDAKTYGYYNYTLLKPSKISQEKIDAMCGEATTKSLLVGYKKKKVGEVKVMNDDENLYLTFTADQYKYMKKVYLNIGAKGSTPFYSNGFPNLRKFNYKAFPYYFGGTKNATYVIPLADIDVDCFEIVAYSKVYDSASRCLYTSFAYDQNLTQTYSYSYYSGCYYYNEWVRSFEYCKQECNNYDTAFARCDESANCFTNDGFSEWGWTNGPYPDRFDFHLYTNVDGCDANEEEDFVGVVSVRFNEDKSAIVRIVSKTDYIIHDTQLYIGSEKYPLDENGNATINPAKYPYQHTELGGVTSDVYYFDSLPEDYYLIAHANVSK